MYYPRNLLLYEKFLIQQYNCAIGKQMLFTLDFFAHCCEFDTLTALFLQAQVRYLLPSLRKSRLQSYP